MAAEEESTRKRTPSSAKLPQATLSEAIRVAETLAELAAPATPAVIAQHMDVSSSSSGFKTKLAAAGYYGLVTVDGGRRTLTQRGTDITGADASKAEAARREAVMSTTFGPILHSLRGRPVNAAILSSRLQGDYAVPVTSADHVASVLVDSATEAGLVANGSFDAVAIEAHTALLPETVPPSAAGGRGATPKPAAAPPVVKAAKEPSTEQGAVLPGGTSPLAPAVQIVIKIDAASLSPGEIAELVRALHAPVPSS